MTLRSMPVQAPRLAAFCIWALGWLVALSLVLSGPALAITPPQPGWAALNLKQQEALKPLAGEWDRLDNFRRKKWLTLAEKYPSMKPEDQKRVQARMAGWAKLTPEQRLAARENFKQTKALLPEQKKAEWQQYQKLPEAQKQTLAAAADAKKPVKQKQQRRAQEAAAKKPAAKSTATAGAVAPVGANTSAVAAAPSPAMPATAAPAALTTTPIAVSEPALAPAPAPAPAADQGAAPAALAKNASD